MEKVMIILTNLIKNRLESHACNFREDRIIDGQICGPEIWVRDNECTDSHVITVR